MGACRGYSFEWDPEEGAVAIYDIQADRTRHFCFYLYRHIDIDLFALQLEVQGTPEAATALRVVARNMP